MMELLVHRPPPRFAIPIPGFSIQRRSPIARKGRRISAAQSGAEVAALGLSRKFQAAAPVKSSSSSSSSSIVLAPSNFLGEFNRLSIADQLFVVLGVLSCLTVGALLTALVAAVPTLKAIHRASVSLEKLSDLAREELPGTMAAIRLSSMEISDLTLELNDLSQEISDGVRSSARAVQAAEVGIRRMGAVAASQTFAMLQERATVPVLAVKPVVANAAETTRQAVIQAQRAMLTLASHPQLSKWFSKNDDDDDAEGLAAAEK